MGRKRAAGNERLGEYVQLRSNGSLELRFPIPEDVRHAFLDGKGQPRATFIRSLGTKDPKLANTKAEALKTQLRAEFSSARLPTASSKPPSLGEFLTRLYEQEVAGFRESLAASARDRQRQRLRPAKRVDQGALDEATRTAWADALLSSDQEEVAAAGGWAADEYFRQHGVKPARSSSQYQAVLEECALAIVDGLIAQQSLASGQTEPTPVSKTLLAAKSEAQQLPNALSENGKLPLSRFFEDVYVCSQSHAHAPSTGERNIPGKRQSVALFTSLIGDMPVAKITKRDLYDLQEKLLKYPDSRRLSGTLKSAPPKVILEKMVAGEINLPPIHPKTVNKHCSNLSSILDYAEERQHIVKADAKGVKARFQDDEDAGRPFYTPELNRIFKLPLFAGCVGENEAGGMFKSGKVLIRDDRFWIPLVLLFTGGRSSEIVGLHVADVVVDHAVPHFIIAANTTRPRLKNRHSRRMVPIHSRLIAFGFLDFVRKQQSAGHERLFPMAEQTNYRGSSAARGQRSLSASLIMRQFNRTHLEHAGARENGGAIKCFRNTFEQEATSKIPSDEVRQRLTGRKVVSTARIYTDNIPRDPDQRSAQLHRLKEEIEKVTYDNVDLDHLLAETVPS